MSVDHIYEALCFSNAYWKAKWEQSLWYTNNLALQQCCDLNTQIAVNFFL